MFQSLHMNHCILIKSWITKLNRTERWVLSSSTAIRRVMKNLEIGWREDMTSKVRGWNVDKNWGGTRKRQNRLDGLCNYFPGDHSYTIRGAAAAKEWGQDMGREIIQALIKRSCGRMREGHEFLFAAWHIWLTRGRYSHKIWFSWTQRQRCQKIVTQRQ